MKGQAGQQGRARRVTHQVGIWIWWAVEEMGLFTSTPALWVTPPPAPRPDSVRPEALAPQHCRGCLGCGVCPVLAHQASLPTAVTMLTAMPVAASWGSAAAVVPFAAHPTAPARASHRLCHRDLS